MPVGLNWLPVMGLSLERFSRLKYFQGDPEGTVSTFLSKEKERQSEIRADHLRVKQQTEQHLKEIESVFYHFTFY